MSLSSHAQGICLSRLRGLRAPSDLRSSLNEGVLTRNKKKRETKRNVDGTPHQYAVFSRCSSSLRFSSDFSQFLLPVVLHCITVLLLFFFFLVSFSPPRSSKQDTCLRTTAPTSAGSETFRSPSVSLGVCRAAPHGIFSSLVSTPPLSSSFLFSFFFSSLRLKLSSFFLFVVLVSSSRHFLRADG